MNELQNSHSTSSKLCVIPVRDIIAVQPTKIKKLLPIKNQRIEKLEIQSYEGCDHERNVQFMMPIVDIVQLQALTQDKINKYISIESIIFNFGNYAKTKQYQIRSVMRQKALSISQLISSFTQHQIQQQKQFWKNLQEQSISLIMSQKYILKTIKSDCIKLYLQKANKNQQYYQILIGFNNFHQNTEYSQGIEKIIINNFNNIISSSDPCEYQNNLIQIPTNIIQKIQQIIQMQQEEANIDHIDCLQQGLCLLLQHYNGYAADTYKLSNMLLKRNDRIMCQRAFTNYSHHNFVEVHFNDPVTKLFITDQFYVNQNCNNIHGFELETLHKVKICPICTQKVSKQYQIKDRQRLIQSDFMKFLSNNFMNKRQAVYLEKNKFLFVGIKQKFQHYSHFREYIRAVRNIRHRNQTCWMKNNEKINLSQKILKNINYPSRYALIQTPVRGKYCKHMQFFDAMQIWVNFNCNEINQFPCFICSKPIEITHLLYLRQMELIIKVFNNLISKQLTICEAFLIVNHQTKQSELIWAQDQQQEFNHEPIQIYNILNDPLLRTDRKIFNEQIVNEFLQFFYI